MALLFMESFDHLGTAFNAIPLWAKWANNSGQVTSTSRTGGFSGFFQYGAVLLTKPLPAVGGFVIGAAIQAYSNGWGDYDLFQIREGSIVHLTVGTDATTQPVGTARLCVKLGSTKIAFGSQVLATSSWYYIEFKGTINNLTGSFEVRVNGVTEIVRSGVDTRMAGTGQWNTLGLTGNSTYFDDLYVCDQSGSRNNDFLGLVKIECLLPQTDAVAAGTAHSLTPSTGSDHGALVDEQIPNTTDYNGSGTPGAKDTYHFPSLVLPGTVVAVQTNLYNRRTDALDRTMCHVMRTGGTDYDGPTVVPSTDFVFSSQIREVNPATGVPWTVAEINALEVGMKVVT